MSINSNYRISAAELNYRFTEDLNTYQNNNKQSTNVDNFIITSTYIIFLNALLRKSFENQMINFDLQLSHVNIRIYYTQRLLGLFRAFPANFRLTEYCKRSNRDKLMCFGVNVGLDTRCVHRKFQVCRLRGSSHRKWSKIIKFLFFAQKVSSGMGALRPKFFRGLAALEPPQKWGAKGRTKGEGFVFFRFRQKKKKKMEKIFCTFCRKSFKDSKTVFFFSFQHKN